MTSPTFTDRRRRALQLGAAIVIASLCLFCALSASAQSFSSTAGLLQGERIARVTTVYDDTLRASTTTTAWIPFGTHLVELASERVFAPTRFTLFVKLDTAGIAHAADPSLTLSAQIALDDTLTAYEQFDGSLDLLPATDPMTTVGVGESMIVPVYGGGWLRFIVTSADTAAVRLSLWRVR